MSVALRHAGTGHIKFIDTGWNWSIFWGAGLLGLPLFFRGMALWGSVMLVLWSLQLAVPIAGISDGVVLERVLNIAVAGLCLYLGYRGNALTARHFVACGYEFPDPDSMEARLAAERWGI